MNCDELNVVTIYCKECGNELCAIHLKDGKVDYLEEFDQNVDRSGLYGNDLDMPLCGWCVPGPAALDREERDTKIREEAIAKGFKKGYDEQRRDHEVALTAEKNRLKYRCQAFAEKMLDKAEQMLAYLYRRVEILEDRLEELGERVVDPDLMIVARRRRLKSTQVKEYQNQAFTEVAMLKSNIHWYKNRLKIRQLAVFNQRWRRVESEVEKAYPHHS